MVTIRMDRDDPRALPHELGHMLGLGQAHRTTIRRSMAAPSEEDPDRVLGESLSPD